MNQRKLLTASYDICLTNTKPIYNDVGAKRKRGCHGEGGEEHEKKCEGTADSEVHVCVID